MPPRVADLNQRTFAQWYSSQPIVTRSLLTVYLITGLGLFFRILPVAYLYHSWSLEFKLPLPQIWRLVTNFTVIGPPSINFLFQLIWLVRYGASYEQAKFGNNAADALTLLLTGACTVMVLDLLIPFFRSYFHGQALIFMFVYLWSKYNPNAPVSFFGIITLQAAYLPFALLFIDMIQGASVTADVMGILAGHVYYFLTEIYPRASGRYLVRTPMWLSRLCYRYGIGQVPRAQVFVQPIRSTGAGTTAASNTGPPAHPSSVGFRAFSGQGRRLAE